jgi:hypothetical protein
LAISAVVVALSLAVLRVTTLPPRGHVGRPGHFRGQRFVPGFYDYGCSYGYPYYTPYDGCYSPSYPPSYF